MQPVAPAFTVVVNKQRLINGEDPYGRFACRDQAWRAVRTYVELLYDGHPRLEEVRTAVEHCRSTNVTDLELFGRHNPHVSILIGVHAV